MSDAGADVVDGASPADVRDAATRGEIRRAAVWLGMASAIALVVLLVQPLLIIFAGLVFAAMLDGGVRLLGRVLPIGRGWRLLIVCVAVIAFLMGTFYLTGVQVAAQFGQLRATLEMQADRLIAWLTQQGVMPGASDVSGLARQALGSVGRITSWVGNAIGAMTTMFMILVIGLFLAMDPGAYSQGLQWMIPSRHRREFAATTDRMGRTLRRLLAGRLLGMAFEGVLTWIALSIVGVPMALILGILTGLLAFIPNIGAFVSGALMVAVGFSAGADTGIAALAVYLVVQTFDGYVVIPMVAKKTVDLPPALTLGAQILASALFGILGLALADPMTAMAKAAMERRAERVEETADARGDAGNTGVMEIVLHDYWRSSAAYRVRACLNLKNVRYRSVSVDLTAGEQRGDANLGVNPQGLVPTLIVDGRALTQSLAIIDWLDANFPDPPMVDADPFVRADQLARALVIAADIHPVDNLRVLRRLETQFGADQAARDDWYRHWVVEGLAALETMARADRVDGPFLGGASPDISDLCLVPQLYNARRFAVPLAAYPTLRAIDAAAQALPAIAAAHPDRVKP